jgi:pimeloyl-ACP methyl ester carboxylesterase
MGTGPGRPRLPIDVGDGPLVVLVHGQPGVGGDWVRLAGALSSDHRVIAPDRPGWGTDPGPAIGLGDNAEALAALIESVGANAPATLVGHSLGGGIALELALRHPQQVGALVLVGSVGVAEALSGWDRLLAVPILGEAVLRAGSAALRRTLSTAARYSAHHPEARLAKKVAVLGTLQAAIGSDGRPMVARSRRSFLVEQRALLAESPGLEERLGQIAVPTAVVTGASDRVVPVGAARSLAARIPGAELVVVSGGHLVPFEQPEVIARIVRRYSEGLNGLRDERQRQETPEA